MSARTCALAALAFACGAAQHQGPPEPGVAIKSYPPLAFKDDAKAPGLAVILGIDGADHAAVIPLHPHPVTVDAMSAEGVTPIELAVGPNATGAAKVDGDLGSAWLAAFAAATTLDKDVTDFAFSATAHGAIDGRSASGLIAAGFIAAVIGAPVDPTATLCGAIDPDGTLGPVDGLAEAFISALAKGKKKLGYPAGMRKVKSQAGKDLDLVDLAHASGAQAIELVDVRDAYHLLTGRTLPAIEPVTEAEMAVDPATAKLLDARYRVWQQRLAAVWSTVVQLDTAGRQPQLLVGLRDRAKSDGEAAERLRKQGKPAAAYAKMLAAWALANSTHQTYDVLSKVEAGDVAGAITAVSAEDPAKIRAAFDQIAALHPTTIGGALDALAAFETALRGWAFHTFAAEAVAATTEYLKSLQDKPRADLGSHETADAVVEHVAPALAFIGQTSAETTLATQELELETATTARYATSVGDVLRLAAASQDVAEAERAAFDAMLIAPLAEKSKLSEDETRRRFAMIEPDYLVALMLGQVQTAEGLPYEIKAAWGDHSVGWGLASLAAGQLGALDAALVLAKYITIGLAADDRGSVAGVDHEASFAQLLAAAERNARASARAAKIATGVIPMRAKLAYELALVERGGDVNDRLDALGELWAATVMSQTAVMMARN